MAQHREQKPKTLPFPVVRDTLDPLAKALTNLINREFPPKLASIPGLQQFLLVAMMTATNTYEAVRFLAADLPEDPSRKLEFGLALEPLVRSLADLVFTLVFMREDLPSRVRWYYRGGWRELKEDFDRHSTTYGELKEWQDYLHQWGKELESWRQPWGVSEAGAAAPKEMKVEYWPTPGRMLTRYKDKLSEKTWDFLTFLNDWVYRGLSASTHVSAAGIARRHHVLAREKNEGREELLRKFKSDGIFTATTLMVALCTEVNSVCDFDRHDKLAYLWGVLVEYWSEANDLFERRYGAMLARPSYSKVVTNPNT